MSDLFSPPPDSPLEARMAAEVAHAQRVWQTESELRERQILAQQEAEDFPEAAARRKEQAVREAKRREEEELRQAAWDQRTRMLGQLREVVVGWDFLTKSKWMRMLEDNPTSVELARLQAEVANCRSSRQPLSLFEQEISFLTLFEVEVDVLLALVRRWEQKFG